MVEGTELNVTVCGHLSRFQICEIRHWIRNGKEQEADRIYFVRDASTVTLEQVREGKRPNVVARFATLDEAEAFVISNPYN